MGYRICVIDLLNTPHVGQSVLNAKGLYFYSLGTRVVNIAMTAKSRLFVLGYTYKEHKRSQRLIIFFPMLSFSGFFFPLSCTLGLALNLNACCKDHLRKAFLFGLIHSCE